MHPSAKVRKLVSFSICLVLAAVAQFGPAIGTYAQATKLAARPEVGQIPEVYTTKGSRFTVATVRYGPRASQRALVEIADLDHP